MRDSKGRFIKGHKTNVGRIIPPAIRLKMSQAHPNGADSHLWKGGITNKNKLARQRANYRLWREAVIFRDGKCAVCGSHSNLEAHHIKPFSLFPELRYAIDNGTTLCHTCHKEDDRIQGLNQFSTKKWWSSRR